MAIDKGGVNRARKAAGLQEQKLVFCSIPAQHGDVAGSCSDQPLAGVEYRAGSGLELAMSQQRSGGFKERRGFRLAARRPVRFHFLFPVFQSD
jgi:hypothetical protein